jgi:hypothetical protein
MSPLVLLTLVILKIRWVAELVTGFARGSVPSPMGLLRGGFSQLYLGFFIFVGLSATWLIVRSVIAELMLGHEVNRANRAHLAGRPVDDRRPPWL